MTNEIVFYSEAGDPVTTTDAIATGTMSLHASVIKLVRTYLADFNEFGGVRFQIQPFETNGGAQEREVAILNEDQSTLLLSYMRNNDVVRGFKKRLIRSFVDMRKQLAAPKFAVPATFAEALFLAAEKQLVIEAQALQIAADKPKVEFAEAIRAVDGVCSIEKIAKTIGWRRNKFFDRLREDSVLMANNLPYQKYIDRGYFTVAEQMPYTDSKGETHPTFATRVTGAGQVFLAKRYAQKMSGDE